MVYFKYSKEREVLKMDYKNNIENQRELLQKHLEAINIVVSAKLGTKVNLCIKESKNYRNQTFFMFICVGGGLIICEVEWGCVGGNAFG